MILCLLGGNRATNPQFFPVSQGQVDSKGCEISLAVKKLRNFGLDAAMDLNPSVGPVGLPSWLRW